MKKNQIMVFFIVLLSLLTALSAWFGLTYQPVITIPYFEKSNLDYKVYLKENNFYDTNVLGKDMKYVASLIDHIDTRFNYTFSTNDKFDYDYNYSILGTLQVTDSSDANKAIFEKEEKLIDVQTKEALNTDKVVIDELLSLDYVKYNEFLNSFKTQYNLNSVNCTLTLTLNAHLDNRAGLFEDSSSLIMKLPLTNQTMDIGIDYNEIDNAGQKTEATTNTIINKACIVLAALLFLTDILLIYIFIKKKLKIRKSISNYEKQLNLIFRKYNRALAKANSIDLKDYDIININTLEDLINIRDTLDKPILFKEIEKNSQAWFIIIEDKIAYRYIFNG